ncbi:hypothetical protein ACHAXR_003049 [Thalassiosira sp. AJA248-18]
MIIIAFFFLLSSGEYTDAPSDSTPFALYGVHLAIGDRRLPLDTVSDAELIAFTTQKNGVENEVIRHPYICAAESLKCQVYHLRSHKAPLSAPLSCVYTSNGSRTQSVTLPALITKTLRATVKYLGADLVFLHSEVSTRSLSEPPALWRYWLPRSAATSSNSLAKLRIHFADFGANLGFLPSELSACSLRATGAMALLVAKVDTQHHPTPWQMAL